MSLKRDIDLLQRVPLFSRAEPEALQLIAFAAEGRSFRGGDVLFRRGDVSDGGYLLTGGAVLLDAGDQSAAMIVQAGVLLGELAMIIDTERPATATAREPTTTLRITREIFRRVMQEFPDSADTMREHLAAHAQATSAGLSSVRYRLLNVDRLDQPLTKGRG